jgi:tetrahydromethanopterin S-methyltransferase subunit E
MVRCFLDEKHLGQYTGRPLVGLNESLNFFLQLWHIALYFFFGFDFTFILVFNSVMLVLVLFLILANLSPSSRATKVIAVPSFSILAVRPIR